jgi:hypothetical protein
MAHVNITDVLSSHLDEIKDDTILSWDDAHMLVRVARATTWESAQERDRAADLVTLIIGHHGSPKHKKSFKNEDLEETLTELCELLRNIVRGAIAENPAGPNGDPATSEAL